VDPKREEAGGTVLKIVIFVFLVPGFLLGFVPVYVIPKMPSLGLPMGPWNWAAVPFWGMGCAILIWCAADFVRNGHATPVPLTPSQILVISGLFRCVRNPVYLGATLIQIGTLIWFGTLSHAVYWFFLFIGRALLIRANEEPFLRKTFDLAQEGFCQSVPHWTPP
jgi:protein-S-isoprenylcysteine O-methyltransferase Ste14